MVKMRVRVAVKVGLSVLKQTVLFICFTTECVPTGFHRMCSPPLTLSLSLSPSLYLSPSLSLSLSLIEMPVSLPRRQLAADS